MSRTAPEPDAQEPALDLADVMRALPQVEEGRLVGFRLEPGTEDKAFRTLGLHAGDVVTDINGTPLDNANTLQQFFAALTSATLNSATVVRAGVAQTVMIDSARLVR